MPQLRSGTTFCDWTLRDVLGEGGNATVWRASGSNGELVALKILNTRNIKSEPYSRFRQEIAILQRLGERKGVLPILEHHLPEAPSRQQRAWLAMPIATPLAEKLRERSLRDVISSIAIIAETLAELKREHGVHHRDIKPTNLYVWQGEPVLSDFGLADIPDGLDLTSSGRPLGPAHFPPYEMLADAAHADPGPADVYLLAKTLWVLCTDQKWPPPGEQSLGNTALSINNFRPHPLARQLDALIDRCTKHQPEERPTMVALAADLRSWLEIESREPPSSRDTSQLWKSLREIAAPRLTEAQRKADELQCVRAAARKLQELLAPLHADIRQNFADARD